MAVFVLIRFVAISFILIFILDSNSSIFSFRALFSAVCFRIIAFRTIAVTIMKTSTMVPKLPRKILWRFSIKK